MNPNKVVKELEMISSRGGLENESMCKSACVQACMTEGKTNNISSSKQKSKAKIATPI